MKILHLSMISILAVLTVSSSIAYSQYPETTTSPAKSSEPPIPQWVKNNAGWWADGIAGKSYFVQGLYYLIDKGILKVTLPGGSLIHATQIPAWVKNDAGWWANGKISEKDFLSSMQYLIIHGIIRL